MRNMTYEQTEAIAKASYERDNPGGWQCLDEGMKAKLMVEATRNRIVNASAAHTSTKT